MDNKYLGRQLSKILRHNIVKLKLKMEPDGFVKIKDLQKLSHLKQFTIDDFKTVVNEDNKTRFKMKQENNEWMIRANQGHSQSVANLLNPELIYQLITKPLPLIVHGTTLTALEQIQMEGLKIMERSHIHFSTTDQISKKGQSGIRINSQVLIYLDMELAMNDGIKFYISENGVVLSNGINGLISKKYFHKIEIKS